MGGLLNPPGVAEIKWKMENGQNGRMRISENVFFLLSGDEF